MKLLVTCIFALIFNSLSAQLIYETVGVEYDSAWEYKSLKLIPIRAKELVDGVGQGSCH